MYYQKNCDMDHGVRNFNILKFFLNKKDLNYYIALNSNLSKIQMGNIKPLMCFFMAEISFFIL